MNRRTILYGALVIAAWAPPVAAQHAVRRAIDGRPDATIDLRTDDGVALAQGQWRYSDARLTEVGFQAPGPDLKPTGAPVKTYDQELHAGAAAFDDSTWRPIEARSADDSLGVV